MKRFAYLLFSIVLMFGLSLRSAQSETAKGSGGPKLEDAYFAAGCFWKVQYKFSKTPGVVHATAGYSGGTLSNPKYQDVCTDKTGHAETVHVEYDPTKTTFRTLLEVFFKMHDPTTPNRQGPDMGTQYRSAIFYTTPEQQKQALEYIHELEQKHQVPARIVTEVKPAGAFYPAEEYHQNYFVKHGEVCF